MDLQTPFLWRNNHLKKVHGCVFHEPYCICLVQSQDRNESLNFTHESDQFTFASLYYLWFTIWFIRNFNCKYNANTEIRTEIGFQEIAELQCLEF